MNLPEESQEILRQALLILRDRIIDVDQASINARDIAILRFRGINLGDWIQELKKRILPLTKGKPVSFVDGIFNRAYAFLKEEELAEFTATKGEGESIIPFVTITEKGIAYLEEHVLNNRVFIVHGHDEAKTLELRTFLATLGLTPIILYEQDDRGLAIVEKFEYYAAQCSFAFVLLVDV